MKIRFTGTGSGKSSLKRFHTSILLDNDHKLLIDAGDGISRALLFNEVSFSSINSIIITHFHPDHISGLPMLLNQMKMENRKDPLYIHVFEKQVVHLEQLCELNLIFFKRLGFEVVLKPFRDNESFTIAGLINVLPRGNSHLDKFGSMDIKCFSLFLEPGEIHYTSDVGTVEDLLLYKDRSPEYVISECTHVVPNEIIKKVITNRIKKIFLVHIDSDDEISRWYKALNKELQSMVMVPDDGFEFGL